jgi:hypothetical protein
VENAAVQKGTLQGDPTLLPGEREPLQALAAGRFAYAFGPPRRCSQSQTSADIALTKAVSALRNIAYRSGFGLPPLAKGPGETAKPIPGRAEAIPGRASDDDANALKQIARGLAENNSSFEM